MGLSEWLNRTLTIWDILLLLAALAGPVVAYIVGWGKGWSKRGELEKSLRG